MEDLDQITIKLAAQGDKNAFRRMYDHYVGFVWRIAYRTVGNDQNIASEVVQDTFVRIHKSLRSFKNTSALGTWIYRIAYNAATSLLSNRTHLRSLSVPVDDTLPGHYEADKKTEASEIVSALLKDLSVEERFLLVAKEVDGLTFEEIAGITGKTSESLRVRLMRLKERIRDFTVKENFL